MSDKKSLCLLFKELGTKQDTSERKIKGDLRGHTANIHWEHGLQRAPMKQ